MTQNEKKDFFDKNRSAVNDSIIDAVEQMKDYGFQDFRVDVRLWSDGTVDHSEFLSGSSWVDYKDEKPVLVIPVHTWQSDNDIDADLIVEGLMEAIDFN